MIDDLIAQHLAFIDDLAELKVTLVALRLIEQRNSAGAHVTADELARHPALRDGLGAFARLSLDMALRKAAARGTLLPSSEDVASAKFFANTPAAKLLLAQLLQEASPIAHEEPGAQTLTALCRLVERLEAVDAYPVTDEDQTLVREWQSQGYSEAELMGAARLAYKAMRKPGHPPRSLKHMTAQLKMQPPEKPSQYYLAVVARTARLDEASMVFELLNDRLPVGPEHADLMRAVKRDGIAATVRTLRAAKGNTVDMLALLDEQEAADQVRVAEAVAREAGIRGLISRVMETIGGTPTSTLADEVRNLWAQVSDDEVWQAALQKAAAENKRNWAYIRAIVSNPSPNLLLPPPVNDAAKQAYDMYRKRIGRGTLDVSVARDMNAIAEKVTEAGKWAAAFDAAAAQNALNWNYIKAVLLGTGRGQETGDGKRPQKATARRGAKAASQREQVSYSDETRQQAAAGADAELAALEERRRKRNQTR